MVQTSVFVAVQSASLALIAASAWIFGATVLRRFGLDDGGPAERWALGSALGLGIMAQALFFVGIAGGFERWVVLALLAAGHLLCRETWRALWRERPRARDALRRAKPGAVVAAAASIPVFVLALYPPTGFDATVYHLPYVEAFLEAGRLVFVPELRFPIFPQVVEMGFLLAFVLAGDVAAKLTQVLSTFLTAALLLAFGRRFGAPRAGLWAAALWLGTPLVVWVGSLAYVDVGMALFVTAALFAVERWRDGEDRRWLALAGVFAGLAAGTKYLGLFFCGFIALASALGAVKRRDLRPTAVLAAAMLLTLAPWYLRIVLHTGNPVFPFYGAVFGESEWTSAHDRLLGLEADAGAGALALRLAERVADGAGFLLLVPWKAVFDRGVFNYAAPSTPFYLALIPLGVPFALGRARERRLLVLAVCFALFWLTTVRDLRFLLPVLPAFNLALLGGLERWTGRLPGRAWVVGLALALLAPGPMYAAYKIHERGRLPVASADRVAYLSRQVSGYGAIRWLNDERGADYAVYALFAPYLRYYAEGRFLGDDFGPSGYHRVLPALGSGAELRDELETLGASHFLVDQRLAKPPRDVDFERSFRPVWRDAELVLYELDD